MSIDVNVQNDLVIVTESSEDITVNVSNAAGPAGVGVPTGGTTGQVLKKLTNTDYDTYWALDGGGVPYSGATGDVNLGEYQLIAGQVTLDTTPTGTASVATTRWNDTTGVSETTLKGGNVILKNGVDLVARVVNKVTPNATLTKATYQAVRISGAQGQRLAVALAQANNDTNSADTIGLVTETIATNQEGFIMTMGQLENINTTGSLQGETWVDGDVLYLSPTTPGAITKVKPTGNGHLVVIGYVEYAHANNGKIYVKILNGFELSELHDVDIVSPANNEALIYESSTALWKNKTIATALGYTPISGSGVTGQVAYWNGTNSQTGSNNLFWDAANARLGIGTNAPSYKLDVTGDFRFNGTNGFIYDTSNSRINFGNVSGAVVPSAFQIVMPVGSFGAALYAENTSTTTNGYVSAWFAARISNTNVIGLNSTTVFQQRSSTDNNYALFAFHNAAGSGATYIATKYINHTATGHSADLLFGTVNAGTQTPKLYLFANGNLVLQNGGTFIDGGQRLQVYGDAFVRGSGNTSGSTALTTQNSDSATLFLVRNNGLLNINGKHAIGTINANFTDFTLSGETLGFAGSSSWTNTGTGYWFQDRLATSTTGTLHQFRIGGTAAVAFGPTSGTAVYNMFTLQNVINQTGGANGITRGLYVNPTLTAAADWRSIEWSNNSGWGLYGAGTADNYLAGRLGIGTTTLSADIDLTKSTGATAFGAVGMRIANTSGTGQSFIIIRNQSFYAGFEIFGDNYGVTALRNTALLTTQNGINYLAFATLGNSPIGFRTNTSSGTTNERLTIFGNGNVAVNQTTDTGEKLQVNGTFKVSGASTFNGNISLSLNQSTGTLISISNTNGAGYVEYSLQQSATAGGGGFGKYGHTIPSYKIVTASNTYLVNSIAGDIAILNDFASGTIKMAAGGSSTVHMTIKANGSVRYQPMATPGTAEAGDVYYDSTSNKLRCYNGTTWNDLF